MTDEMERIGNMIDEESSLAARTHLETNNTRLPAVAFAWETAQGPTLRVGDALMMPLFLPKGIANPQLLTEGTFKSQDVTTNTRRELSNYYSYTVKFRDWGRFAVDIDRDNVAFGDSLIDTTIISDAVVTSFNNSLCGQGESIELGLLASNMSDVLAQFDFNLMLFSPPQRDFNFVTVTDNTTIVSGEAKGCIKLPDTDLRQPLVINYARSHSQPTSPRPNLKCVVRQITWRLP
jgi:hypothetical protein